MSKPTLTKMLENLSPEDLGEVLELIQQKTQTEQPTKKRKQKRHRKQESPASEPPPKRIILPGEEAQRPTTSRRASSRRRTNEFDIHEHRRQRSQGRGNKGAQARAESLDTGKRPNEFLKMRERHAYKNDTKIDILLSGGNEVTERRQKLEYIEIQCKRCNRWFDVLPSQLHSDPDEGITFICDDCSMERAE